MTRWQRFGDGTWVNVDHVEVIRVEEDEDGGWRLNASFASGSTHALGSHKDRDLLLDCTDALLRERIGEHLQAVTGVTDVTDAAMADPAVVPEAAVTDITDAAMADPAVVPEAADQARARWKFWRTGNRDQAGAAQAHPDGARIQPVA